MSKLDALKKLRDEINIKIEGKDNYPKDAPSVIVTNHNRLMDIFYLPCCVDKDIISLVSARLVYKKDLDRLNIVNKYLNAFPIEAHGGKIYSDMCLKEAIKILLQGNSLSIFPEGAYLEGKEAVHRGRTGAARIVFSSLDYYNFVYFLPISIDIDSNDDIDSYIPNKSDNVTIKILDPINPIKYYRDYNSCSEKDRNSVLHNLTNEAMITIANSLNRKYIDEYIKLFPKGNVMFSDGSKIDTIEAQNIKYISKYESDIKKLSNKLINECGDGR